MATENEVAAFMAGIGVMCDSLDQYKEQLEYWTSTTGCGEMDAEIRNAKSNKPDVSKEELEELFYYDPDVGCLRWKEKRGKGVVNPGDRFGSVSIRNEASHRLGTVMGKSYYEHRLIWLLIYGEWPNVVDHIDGDGLNNKLDNLRNVSHQENCRNTKVSHLNTSGHIGVWQVRTGNWVASIGDSGANVHLGTFSNYEDAVEARRSAEKSLGYHENHGKRR